MSSFDDRQRGFENKFIQDQETAFRLQARRNRLLGVWACDIMRKTGKEAEDYANALAESVVNDRRRDIPSRVLFDFTRAGLDITLKEVREAYEECLRRAQQDILGHTS
jgi:hypothetical protein